MSDVNVFNSDAEGGRIPEKFGMARVVKEGGFRRLMLSVGADGIPYPRAPGRVRAGLSSDLLASFSATIAASK